MNKPLVSVIIPAYNAEKRLAATLKTIINQDYENIEIIFVNNASTDNTLKIAEDIFKNSGRVYKIINHEKNLGISASRNDGLDSANGKYVWFCDSDDLPDENFISIMYRKIEDENADLVFCGIKAFFKDENRYEDFQSDLFSQNKTLSSEEFINLCMKQKTYCKPIWNCLIKKTFIDNFKLRFTNGCRMLEDSEFAMKAVTSASRVAFENRVFYTYVDHSDQTTRARDFKKNPKLFDHAVGAMYRVTRYILRRTKDKRVKNYVLSYYVAAYLLRQCKLLIRARDKEDYERKAKTLRHKKIRQIICSTAKFIFSDPELFFKLSMITYLPKFYYRIRSII